MREISPGLKKLTKLKKLYLGDNGIPVLNPLDFVGFPDLEYLEFANCKDDYLRIDTGGWGELKSLKALFIGKNKLEVLDGWVGRLQALEELNIKLRNNKNCTIKDAFFLGLSKLPNFRILKLELYSIDMLPLSILLLKGKNVKITVECKRKPYWYEINVSQEILEKEFGDNIVFL